MIVPDSSVLVAGFVVEHPAHASADVAVAEVKERGTLIAHTMAEAYAVLSSPGGAYRAAPDLVVEYLDEFLAGSEPILPRPDAHREVLGLLSGEGRGGASVHDALIAMTARDAGASLISLDRRARPVYERCGADVRFLDAA